MIRGLYNWTMKKAESKAAEGWLAFVAFLESSIFPIPPDIMLLPMVLAQRERAFRIAAICTIASVLGAAGGYLIGMLAWETIGEPIINFYGYHEKFAAFQGEFKAYGVWAVAVFGLTFLPFKVITIASGLVGLNFPLFILASILSRSPRFFIEAALLWKFGEPIRDFIEKRLTILMSLFVFLLILGFVLLKFL